MWSARAFGRGAAASLLLLGLVGCQVRPLYGEGPGQSSPQPALAAIVIDPPVTREEQIFRNALDFGFRGGATAAPARYHLVYRLTIRESQIAVERRTGTPNAYQLDGSVSFLVQDISTGEAVVGASVTAIASYNRSTQAFANIRAERDAEERLLKVLAQLTQARLAAYFAAR